MALERATTNKGCASLIVGLERFNEVSIYLGSISFFLALLLFFFLPALKGKTDISLRRE